MTKQKSRRQTPVLITEIDPKSPSAEAYRSLRTNIQFAGLDDPHRSLVITSSSAGEGKTTTAANFAIVCAQGGTRVCLIDADLRRPTIHRLFNLPNTHGLTTALLEDMPFVKFAHPTRVPNLSVLTSGAIAPNPAEMVGSKRMRELIQGGAADFDLLLFDTPPVISVSDGVALAAQCDGVILVIRVGTVPHTVIRRCAEQIEAVKGRILGVLLNSVNLKRDSYYYDYYRYYSAYYGDEKKR